MARVFAASAVLAMALLASCASGAAAVYVNDTVTAVAIRKEFANAILKLVGTPGCAVDNKIFLADFTTCDFQWAEDAVAKKEKISPVACDKKCAKQWSVVTDACATQFRERMEGDRRFGKLAVTFFAKCDSKTNQPEATTGTETTTKPTAKPEPATSKPGTISSTSMETGTDATLNAPTGTDKPATTTTPADTTTTTPETTTTPTDTTTTTTTPETTAPAPTPEEVAAAAATAAAADMAALKDAAAAAAANTQAPAPNGAGAVSFERALLALVAGVALLML